MTKRPKRSRTEQWQVIIITITILLILGFGNVIEFLNNIKNTKFFGFLNVFPSDWLNLFILLFLIYVLFENKKFAEKLAGKI